MPGPVTDVRAGVLRRRYHQRFGGVEVPVPVTAIAEDLCGLSIEEDVPLAVSGMLIPAERRIYLNASEAPERRRFTLAHELGHWVCQCLQGLTASRYCRADEVGLDATAKALEREANVFAAELLMPREAVRAAWTGSALACANMFGVSEEAMHWRVYNLGIVEHQPHPQETARASAAERCEERRQHPESSTVTSSPSKPVPGT
jgi:Zn-dependent peptidase ImmA (M78 family)